MLGRYIDKGLIDVVLDTDPVLKIYKVFSENLCGGVKKYLVVVDAAGKPRGIIRQEDVANIKNAACIMDYVSNRLVTVENNVLEAEIEQTLFVLAKEKIDVVVVIEKDGTLAGVWEKKQTDISDFYIKYSFIKQTGYSIADWINFYYGQNATIGVHSYTEYTELLLNDILNSGIQVKFICQAGGNARGFCGKILERPFSDLTDETVKDCDFIINTFMSLSEQVQYLYRKYRNYNKVVSMYDIVNELFYYERDAGYMLQVANMIARTGRKVYIFDYPRLSKQKNRSPRENTLLEKGFTWSKIQKLVQSDEKEYQREAEQIIMPAMNKIRKSYGSNVITYDEYRKHFPSISDTANSHIKYVGDSVIMYDMVSPHVHIKNGMRATVSAPDNKLKEQCTKIHFFGKSWVYGYHCSDEYTFPSMVQKISNDKSFNYYVYNHGVPGLKEENIANYMYEQNEKFSPDEIFILVHMFEDYGNQFNKKVATECGYVNLLSADRPHDYGEIWVDSGHIGEDGSELLAKQIIDGIQGNAKTVPGVFRNKFNSSAGRPIFKYEVKDQASLWADMSEFRDYQNYIMEHRQKIGAIVMNCNPFTLGHQYLIETASGLCEKLYIFVVEEDKSIFPFEDRLKLVQEGVKDLKNVTVLHSGNFIISALTFPGYFNKSVDNNVSVDTSDDLILFAKHIAPTLGINIRFAGEEPIDYITRQYNETMKEILPKYNIEFVEIPRKEMGDAIISASRVRKLLFEENFDEIAKIVPQTTLEYLKRNQFKNDQE